MSEKRTRGGQGLRALASFDGGARGVQAKRLSSCDRVHGNPAADGRALELRERVLTIAVEVEVEVEPEPELLGVVDWKPGGCRVLRLSATGPHRCITP